MSCKNCLTELSEQGEYCKNCDVKVIKKRLSFRNLFVHLSETFFNYDNKLLRTFTNYLNNQKMLLMVTSMVLEKST